MATYRILYTNAETDELEAETFSINKGDGFTYFRDENDANVFVVRTDSIQSIACDGAKPVEKKRRVLTA